MAWQAKASNNHKRAQARKPPNNHQWPKHLSLPLKLLLWRLLASLLSAVPCHRPCSILVILFIVAVVKDNRLTIPAVQDEGLKNLMMSWYYAGYYTGLLEGQQKAYASMQEGG